MILVLAACLLSLAYLQSETETVHEVNVVIDSMEFVVEQHQLNVEEGDSVRFTIHNRDEGVTHSFEIDGVEENNIRYGETATIELRIDELPDQLNYVCRQHPLMRGVLSLTGL